MFEILPTTTKIPFMKYRIPMVLLSGALTAAAIFFMLTKGFNFGVDFEGGVQMILSFPKDTGADAEKLRSSLEKMGIDGPSVQSYGDSDKDSPSQEFMIHFSADYLNDEATAAKIESALASARPADMKADEKLIAKFRFVGVEKAYISFSRSLSETDVKKALEKVDFGLAKLNEVSPFGRSSQNEFQLMFGSVGAYVTDALKKDFPSPSGQEIKAQRVDFVGAKVGSDLRMSALLSLLITTALMFVYIFIRFDLAYAPGVVAALLHDVIIVAGFFAFFGWEFDLTIVAALLTLAGYSINDTIVIFDRIREVAATMKGKAKAEIIDIAINQTLARTIITGGSTFLACVALFLFGGPVIHGFSAAFLIGIIVGTYSSVFVASPLILWTGKLLGESDTKLGKRAA